jgi:hypothetical protein
MKNVGKRQKVSDVKGNDALDIIHRRVVRNGNSHTLSFGGWLNDWRNVRLFLLEKSNGHVVVKIQSLDQEIAKDAQTTRV